MAAQSPITLERNEVDYRWIQCRSTLNRVNGSRVDFEWSINPYRGCEFGCVYCYARYTHEYMEHHDPMEFERIIYLKRHAAHWLRRELARGKYGDGETIAIGAATDPYQPAEKLFKVTRSILEVLAEFGGCDIHLTTKSDLILRDLDLFRRIVRRHRFMINLTVTTCDAELARLLEPRAPTPRRRLQAVRELNAAGIKTGIFCVPVLPGINDREEQLEAVFQAARDAGAAFILAHPVFLTACSKKRYLPFVQEHFPQLSNTYRDYYSTSSNPPAEYREIIRMRVKRLREKHGFARDQDESFPEITPANCESAQLSLF
ncbi:radical SAM protein [Candidatus Sumerlaeota bacterium]|nr:radical SAM protein [Candidatus Sumerlaeota bacterium]